MKTLDDMLKRYLEYLQMLNYSHHTVKIDRCTCTAFNKWLSINYGLITCCEIRKDHLSEWFKYINGKTTAKGLPLKAVSINHKIQSIRSFMRYMAKEGFISKMLPDHLEFVKVPEFLPTNVMNNATVKKLLRKIDVSTKAGCRDRAVLELMYTAGLRSCEVISLDIGDIDFENGTAKVTGKGKKERIVPIGKTALRHLNTWVLAVRPFMAYDTSEKALFVTQYSKRMKYSCLLQIIKKYARKAKIKQKVATHSMRRSCTTELVKSGANLYHIKELLGHRSFDTIRHYAKLSITDLQKTHAKHHPREQSS